MSKEQHQRIVEKCINSHSNLMGLENTIDGITRYYQCRLNPASHFAYDPCKFYYNNRGISICRYREMCGKGVDN